MEKSAQGRTEIKDPSAQLEVPGLSGNTQTQPKTEPLQEKILNLGIKSHYTLK